MSGFLRFPRLVRERISERRKRRLRARQRARSVAIEGAGCAMTGPTAGRPGGGRRGSAPLPVQRRASLSPQPPGLSAPTSLGPSPKQSPRPSIEGSPKESPPPAEQNGPPSPGGERLPLSRRPRHWPRCRTLPPLHPNLRSETCGQHHLVLRFLCPIF
ncbi:hypothetical protein MRX96_034372 [Rhipicephalus microplus]